MFLDNPLEDCRRRRVIPRAFRVNNGDGPLFADAQAIRLSAIDDMIARHEPQLRQPALQIFPRFQAGFFRRALGLGLIAAQKNVAADVADPQAFGDLHKVFDIYAFLGQAGITILDCTLHEFDQFRYDGGRQFVVR
jgi:hypothetical protein